MRFIPHQIKKRGRSLAYFIRYWGTKEYCHACQRRSSHFKPFDLRPFSVDNGVIPPIIVSNTRCPWCGSHLHHRLMWKVLPEIIESLKSSNSSGRKTTVLHFAPESFSLPRLREIAEIEYITTDYLREDVMVKLDMCRIELDSESIDLVIASHVLEHVDDDKLALGELYRILRPGGKAVLLVPLLSEYSYEREDRVSDSDRLRYYGQNDHVRAYGLDLRDRIATLGFEVEVIRARDYPELHPANYLVDVQGVLFKATKPKQENV